MYIHIKTVENCHRFSHNS